LHGAPVSASDGHRIATPTILAIRTAIIPPPAEPAITEKHPTPR
jgi:hypothetical protein